MPSRDSYARSHGVANVVLLVTLGVAACLDYVTALGRSLIPIELDATVVATRIAREKHPGVDDAHLVELRMQNGLTETLEVDAPVFAAIETGDRVVKARGERQVKINATSLELEPSADAKAMRILIVLFFAPAALAAGLRMWAGSVDG